MCRVFMICFLSRLRLVGVLRALPVVAVVIYWISTSSSLARDVDAPNVDAANVGSSERSGCTQEHYLDHTLIVCRFSRSADIRVFLNGPDGKPFRHFNVLNDHLAAESQTLIFAMNGGMYHMDRSPVGQYVEDGAELTPLNKNDGPGNFHLKPNGVFQIWTEDGQSGARVATALTADRQEYVEYATQSGPMLVIDGKMHPRFLSKSDSLKRRNGVGVDDQGTVWFVLSDTPINFYTFASYFRDKLETPNALYLDGTISRIFAPELGRNDPGAAMGPIIGVVKPAQ